MSSGTLFIITAPSGAGKTTLVKSLLERDGGIRLSVSYTTRAPRAGEVHGREYHFVDEAAFKAMQAAGEFVEWAQVHGNYYGTSALWLRQATERGEDILLEIDWQGAGQVRAVFPDAVGVFILPPSFEALETRLQGRGTDTAEVIARRLAGAHEEMRHACEFDYAILNDRLEDALEDLLALVRAARLRYRVQQARFPAFFALLQPQEN
jgi:guanylate kinase